MTGGPRVNLMIDNENVPDIKRRIRVVNEVIRSMRHSLPFNITQKLMTIHVILNIENMLNYFTTKTGL